MFHVRFALAFLAFSTGLSAAPAVTDRMDEAEETYELRLERVLRTKGQKALIAHLERELKERPRPYVKAWYANYLLYGAEFGLKELSDPVRGFALAKESCDEGSLFGLELVGRAYSDGRGTERSLPQALEHLNRAVMRDRHTAMAEIGKLYFFGMGVPKNHVLAETWIRSAATRGAYGPMDALAEWWENPQYVGTPDRAKANALYYEVGNLGSSHARAVLVKRAKAGDMDARKYVHLDLVVVSVCGHSPLPSELKAAVKWLEANASPDDARVQLALAEVMIERELAVYNVEAAKAKLARLVAAGHDDAKSVQADMAWRGIGQKKDEAAAIATWRELALRSNGRGLNQMGWLSWWGAGEKFGVPKDAAQAFKMTKESADLGYWAGQLNVATAYAHGIGVPKNYFMAAKYYGILEDRRYKGARVMKDRILAMVKD